MEVIHPRCAGIDVSKRDAKVCVRIQGRGRKATSSTVTTWTSMTSSILALREHLIAERVSCVVIESTAAYWKPFYFVLEDALNVVLVNAGVFDYGLVVEELHDTAEIVVKPMGRHLKGLHEYAGATILGDGRVAVILDVAGLAARASLSCAKAEAVSRKDKGTAADARDVHSLLLFRNAPAEICAVAVEQVARIERIRPEQVQYLGGRRIMQYRGATLPLVALHDTAAVGDLAETERWVVIVFERAGKPLGLLAAEPLDLAEAVLDIDTETLRQRGIAGSAVHKDRTILLLDIFELAGSLRSDGSPAEVPAAPAANSAREGPTVLLAEDSDFFRGQIQRLMEAIGCRVLAAEDGQAAWELLERHAGEVDFVTTDIEMPRLDGLALTRQIRADRRFAGLPVIALSSLAGEEEIARGLAAGVNEYQVKLNKDELLASIQKAVRRPVNTRNEEACRSGGQGELS